MIFILRFGTAGRRKNRKIRKKKSMIPNDRTSYNADGIRTKKVGTTTVEYILNGTKILAEKNGDHIIRYFYDAQGAPVGVILDDVTYLYEKNIFGDVK